MNKYDHSYVGIYLEVLYKYINVMQDKLMKDGC